MKTVSRNIILEAINQELSKKNVSEGILDTPSNIVAGVKNAAAAGYGAYNSGKVSNQLKRTAERIGKEWETTSEKLKKPIEKLANSSNPDVKTKALTAINKIQDVERDIKSAVNKMSNINTSPGGVEGQNKALLNPLDDPEDFKDKEITTAYGNKYTETPIQRWVKMMGMGTDTKNIGVHEWAKINKAWLEMRTAGINPFKMTPQESEKFLHYERLRNKFIESGQGDPYGGGYNEHWDYVFGKPKANEMRQKMASHYGVSVDGLKDLFGVPRKEDENSQTSDKQSIEKSNNLPIEAVIEAHPLMTDKIKKVIRRVLKKDGEQAARNAIASFEKLVQMHKEKDASSDSTSTSPEQSPPVVDKLTPKPIPGNINPAHSEKNISGYSQEQPSVASNQFRNPNKPLELLPKPQIPEQPQTAPAHSERNLVPPMQAKQLSPSHAEKKISGKEISTPVVRQLPASKPVGMQSVKQLPVKQVGNPKMDLPKVYTPKISDFFADDSNKTPDGNKKLPVVDKGSEIQVGDINNPGFDKTEAPVLKKKRPSSRKKKTKKSE